MEHDFKAQKDEKELRSAKQKDVLQSLVLRLSKERSDLYYQSTSEIAAVIYDLIRSEGHALNIVSKEIVEGLSRRDIQVLLAS